MTVRLTRHDDFDLITIDRPEALNALSFAIIDELGRLLDAVEASDARGLLVIGAGEKAFCAGADITELMGNDQTVQKRRTVIGQRTFERISTLSKPSLAVLNGFAFGGGLELAMACTLRCAVPRAKVGLPEIKLGLIPGYGGTQRLPRLVGEARAMEMVLTGRFVGAEEALSMGLVTRLIEPTEQQSALDLGAAYLREVTGFGLPAIAAAREAVSRALDLPVSEGLKVEADLSTLMFQTADAAEGMTAFVEKRAPRFEDR